MNFDSKQKVWLFINTHECAYTTILIEKKIFFRENPGILKNSQGTEKDFEELCLIKEIYNEQYTSPKIIQVPSKIF